jgi:anaerobic selenocysteine-containing dehydrogenase
MGLEVVGEGIDLAAVTEDELLAPIAGRGRAGFEELQANRVIVDEPATFGWVERSLPEGRWQLAPQPLVDQLDALLDEPAPRDAAGQLVLVPRRQLRHMNSLLRDAAPAGGRLDEPEVTLHPADAALAGVVDGELVALETAHGTAIYRARLDDATRPGVAGVPHGWSGDASVGALTSAVAGCDPLTGMVQQSGIAVTLRRGARPSP